VTLEATDAWKAADAYVARRFKAAEPTSPTLEMPRF
jgi:hypothetical protein